MQELVFRLALLYVEPMTKVLDGSEPFIVPEGHRAAVLEGLQEAERGEFVSDEEMATLWKRCGLETLSLRGAKRRSNPH